MEQPAMSWPEHLQGSLTAPSEEFNNYLDFDMPFTDLEHGPGNMQDSPLSTTTDSTAHLRSTAMQYPGQMDSLAMDFGAQDQTHAHPNQLSYSTPQMTPGFCAQPSPMSQPQSQHYLQNHTLIPPTPNSVEMHGNAARYTQRVDGTPDMYDGYARINEEQALYTPLVSPAMTPLENQFRLPEYTIPGEYFTPLTSPALEAQNADSNSYQFHARQVSDVGFVSSPAEANALATTAPGSPNTPRKPNTRRRASAASSRLNNARKVKQSPNILAQRKRTTLATNSEEFYNSLTQELNATSAKLQNQDIRSLQASSNEASGADSVSPEPLSEPLMPPPALPAPRMSPAITPHTSSSGGAATPALLMRLQRKSHSQDLDPSGQFRGQAQLAESDLPDEIMEDISLPEAAAPPRQRPKPNRIDTAIRTPSTSANGTPLLAPSPASHDQFSGVSLAPSPNTAAMPSPSGPIPRKADSKSAASRKRGSLSSTHASPQLRPKISPSIQPLMKGSEGMAQDALYLASKSNYQHILDGTLPSGVSYPETLAENLSSKRTNHKLAEQGRRNRINSALKEIEQLIPQQFIDARNAKEPAESGGKVNEKEKEKEKSNQTISKATAVEMAIDYIKALKKTLDTTTAKLAAAEAQLLGESKGSSNKETVSTSPASSKPAIDGADTQTSST